MKFLDTLYLLCCNLYKRNDKSIFKESGLILLAGVGMLNIILITFVAADLHTKNVTIDKLFNVRYYIVLFSILLLLVILYIRYFIITSYEEVSLIFYRLSHTEKNVYLIIGSIYLILSCLSTIGYAFYKGGHVNGWW